MEKISCYFIILLARRHHAFGVLAGTTVLATSRYRAFRASETAQTQLASTLFCLDEPSVAKKGVSEGDIRPSQL